MSHPQNPTPMAVTKNPVSPLKVALVVIAVCILGGVIIGAIAGLTSGDPENAFIGAAYAGFLAAFLPGLPLGLIAAGIVWARNRKSPQA